MVRVITEVMEVEIQETIIFKQKAFMKITSIIKLAAIIGLIIIIGLMGKGQVSAQAVYAK